MKRVTTTMSDQDTETELSKEERLEAARKKFEAMKKKKKKAGKKKTESDSREGSTVAEGETPEPKDNAEAEPGTDTGDTEANDNDKGSLAANESKSKTVSESDISPANSKKPTHGLNSDKDAEHSKETENIENLETNLDLKAISKLSDNTLPIEDATSDDVNQLKTIIETQKKTISKLRDENTDLKLEQLDLNDRITALEAEVQQLQSSGSQVEPHTGKTKVYQAHTQVLPAKPIVTSNEYALASQVDLSSKFETVLDFRERLLLWKGWQVDMTSWNGVKGQPMLPL